MSEMDTINIMNEPKKRLHAFNDVLVRIENWYYNTGDSNTKEDFETGKILKKVLDIFKEEVRK